MIWRCKHIFRVSLSWYIFLSESKLTWLFNHGLGHYRQQSPYFKLHQKKCLCISSGKNELLYKIFNSSIKKVAYSIIQKKWNENNKSKLITCILWNIQRVKIRSACSYTVLTIAKLTSCKQNLLVRLKDLSFSCEQLRVSDFQNLAVFALCYRGGYRGSYRGRYRWGVERYQRSYLVYFTMHLRVTHL